MTDRVGGWIRVVLLGLAVPNLVTGLWAVLAARHWFETFPGAGPRFVAGEPPFNHHLATDAGAGFLAVGLAVLIGALWADRRVVQAGLFVHIAHALPHLVYHLARPAPGLTGAGNLLQAGLVAGSAIAATALLAVVTLRTRSAPPAATDPPTGPRR